MRSGVRVESKYLGIHFRNIINFFGDCRITQIISNTIILVLSHIVINKNVIIQITEY